MWVASVSQIDSTSAKEPKAGLAEAQAGMGGYTARAGRSCSAPRGHQPMSSDLRGALLLRLVSMFNPTLLAA